jgi:hypothetical protein
VEGLSNTTGSNLRTFRMGGRVDALAAHLAVKAGRWASAVAIV